MSNELIVTRKEAIEKGLKLYFTGKKCKNGHVSARRIDYHCVECQVETMRVEHDKDREKVNARNRLYSKKNRLALNKYKRERYAKKRAELIGK